MTVQNTTAQQKPKWARGLRPAETVRKLTEAPPAFESLPPITTAKPRPGEPIRFNVSVVAEPVSAQGKRAVVFGSGPGWSDYEIFCDEGTIIGGTDEAPSPLAYMTSGIAFCLLTHLTMYIHMKKLDVDRLKIELRGNFMTTMSWGYVESTGQDSGACEALEAHLIVDSKEPPERIRTLLDTCAGACMAMQTAIQAVPTRTKLVLNGAEVPS
jgi:uncharacterized OsmC-like protein